jgi:hypothetical protein
MMILILWTVKDRGATVDDQTGALVTETFGYDGRELALALGLRHSGVYGAVLAGRLARVANRLAPRSGEESSR